MNSLVYVSRPRFGEAERYQVLDDIHAISVARNGPLDVTGLLISTSRHFAQWLEGPKSSIAVLMASILRDPRHCDVRVIRESPDRLRCFPLWQMARFDGQAFGTFGAEPLLAACHLGEDPEADAKLDRLMVAFARGRLHSRAGSPQA